MQKRAILIITATLLIIAVQAQKHEWTFSQCLDTALRRNIALNQSLLSNDLNKINLDQSRANLYPYLSSNARAGIGFGRSLNPTTNQFVEQATNSVTLSLNAGMNLFNGLQNRRTILQNKMNLDAGRSDIEDVKNQVTLDITMAYLQVLFSYEILKTARSQADATAVQVDQTDKMVKVGKLPESNLLTIKSQQATDNLAVVNAQSNLDLAKVALQQLMELPVDDSFEVVVPALTEPSLIIARSNDQIYQKALTVQPQIEAAATRTRSAMMGIKISEGARWPTLTLTGAVNTTYAATSRFAADSATPKASPFFNQMWNNLGETFGVNLGIPIFTNRLIKSNIERAKVDALIAGLNEKDIRIQLRKTIEQSYIDLRNSIKKFEATTDQIAAAQLSYENMERKYKVGLATAIDFLIEKNAYYLAQSNGIQSKYDYIFKSKILDFYQGKPITF